MSKYYYRTLSLEDRVKKILNTKSTLVPKEVLLKDLYANYTEDVKAINRKKKPKRKLSQHKC
jgi:hypothetical protein